MARVMSEIFDFEDWVGGGAVVVTIYFCNIIFKVWIFQSTHIFRFLTEVWPSQESLLLLFIETYLFSFEALTYDNLIFSV